MSCQKKGECDMKKQLILIFAIIIALPLAAGCSKKDNDKSLLALLFLLGSRTPMEYPSPYTTLDLHVSVSGSDTTGDGSINAPYRTITKALSAAQAGQTIGVSAGAYGENLVITGEAHLHGGYDAAFTARDTGRYATTITDTRSSGGTSADPLAAVKFDGSAVTSAAVIDGFTINAGGGATSAGISCLNAASPTVSCNTINGGAPSGRSMGIFTAAASSAMIRRNTISGGSGTQSYAIYNNASWPYILGNVISGGSGSDKSGGIFNLSTGVMNIFNNVIRGGSGPGGSLGIMNQNGAATIISNTIDGGTGGTMSDASTGIFNISSGSVIIRNNIVVNSGSNTRYGIRNVTVTEAPTVDSTCIYVAGDSGTDYGTSSGNNKLDPHLGGTGGLEPTASSPTGVTEGGTREGRAAQDIHGIQRTVPFSMGAYECDMRGGLTAADAAICVSEEGSDDTGAGTRSSPYRTLTKALSVAVEGDRINVAGGIYVNQGAFIIDRNLSLYGGWNNDFTERLPEHLVTVLRVQASASSANASYEAAIRFDGSGIGSSTVLDGFAIYQPNIVLLGDANHEPLYLYTVLIENGASPVITNNLIVGGTGFYNGSLYGIFINSGSPVVSGNYIRGGFAIYRTDSIHVCSSSGGVIVNNTILIGSSKLVSESGIYLNGSNPVIVNNTIRGSGECYDTSGMSIMNGSSPVVINNVVHIPSSSSSKRTGGIYFVSSSPIVENNCIRVEDDLGAYFGITDGNTVEEP